MPQQPDIEEAGETLEELGETWAQAPRKIQHEMLRVIFKTVYVDVLGERLVCVRPYPQFAPLFRMDGMEERQDGCFYPAEDKA